RCRSGCSRCRTRRGRPRAWWYTSTRCCRSITGVAAGTSRACRRARSSWSWAWRRSEPFGREGPSMNATHLVMRGTVKPDGTLELEGKTNLPPGRVRVTMSVVPEQPEAREDVLTVLERIRAEREALGMTPRSAEEIDAEINGLRDEL